MGRKGGKAGGAKRRAASAEKIAQKVAALTPAEAFKLGRYYKFMDDRNLKRTARREGFAEGYEACIAAMGGEA